MASTSCCGNHGIQISRISLNVLLLLSAFGLVVTGSYYVHEYEDLYFEVPHALRVSNILMITSGCLLIVLSVMALTVRQTKPILLLYIIAMFGVMVLDATAISYGSPCHQMGTSQWLIRYSREYYVNKHYKRIMDRVQTKLQCCGAYGPRDYLTGNFPSAIPESCYSNKSLYDRGCYSVFYSKYILMNCDLFYSIRSLCLLLELGSAVLALVLYCHIKKKSATVV